MAEGKHDSIHDYTDHKECGFNMVKPMFHFYTPWKHHKISGFLTFLGGIELENWVKVTTIAQWR